MSEIYKEKPIVKVIALKGKDGTGSKLSELDNDMTFLTREEIITLVTNIIETGTTGDIDTGFVTTVKEQNNHRGLKFWVGTKAEYDAILEHDTYTFYIITDDDSGDVDEKLAELKTELEEEIRAAVEGVNYDDEIAALNSGLSAESDQRAAQDTALAQSIAAARAEADEKISETLYSNYEDDNLNYWGGGYLSGSSRVVLFSMPLRKSLPSNFRANFDNPATIGLETYLKLTVRQDGNYILGTSSSPYYVTGSSLGQSPDVSNIDITNCGNYINIKITFGNDVMVNPKNNSQIAIECRAKFEALEELG